MRMGRSWEGVSPVSAGSDIGLGSLSLVDGLGFWARWASLMSSGVGGTRANQSWLKTRSRFLSSRKTPTLPRLGSPVFGSTQTTARGGSPCSLQ